MYIALNMHNNKRKLPHSRPKNVMCSSSHVHCCSGHSQAQRQIWLSDFSQPDDGHLIWSTIVYSRGIFYLWYTWSYQSCLWQRRRIHRTKHLEKWRTLLSKAPWEAKDIVVLCLRSFISPKSDLESRMNNFKWSISSYLWTKICEVKFCGILRPLVWFSPFLSSKERIDGP
jgi:hypothetical protein